MENDSRVDTRLLLEISQCPPCCHMPANGGEPRQRAGIRIRTIVTVSVQQSHPSGDNSLIGRGRPRDTRKQAAIRTRSLARARAGREEGGGRGEEGRGRVTRGNLPFLLRCLRAARSRRRRRRRRRLPPPLDDDEHGYLVAVVRPQRPGLGSFNAHKPDRRRWISFLSLASRFPALLLAIKRKKKRKQPSQSVYEEYAAYAPHATSVFVDISQEAAHSSHLSGVPLFSLTAVFAPLSLLPRNGRFAR